MNISDPTECNGEISTWHWNCNAFHSGLECDCCCKTKTPALRCICCDLRCVDVSILALGVRDLKVEGLDLCRLHELLWRYSLKSLNLPLRKSGRNLFFAKAVRFRAKRHIFFVASSFPNHVPRVCSGVCCKQQDQNCCCVSAWAIPPDHSVPFMLSYCFVQCIPKLGVLQRVAELRSMRLP